MENETIFEKAKRLYPKEWAKVYRINSHQMTYYDILNFIEVMEGKKLVTREDFVTYEQINRKKNR